MASVTPGPAKPRRTAADTRRFGREVTAFDAETRASARAGSPIDIADPQSPQRVEQQLREGGTYIDFTWALVLNERPGQGTRLLVRTRANYSPRAIRLLALPWGLVDATYGVAMLRAIARRAETSEPTRT